MGNIEPKVDLNWNDLMFSWAAHIQNDYSIFPSEVEFFPGDTFTLGFEDGTELDPQSWQAIYNSPGYTGPLVTGRDFYNFFVDPCASPDSYSESSAANTEIFQPNLFHPVAAFGLAFS